MFCWPIPRTWKLLLFAALGLAGCAGVRSLPVVPLQPGYSSSRQGLLHYKVPVGWFDASRDSQFVRTEVWLMRNDFAATISVSEIALDDASRRAIEREGPERLAELSVALTTADGSTIVLQPLEKLLLGQAISYTYVAARPATADTLRVAVVDTGKKVFEVTALVPGKSPAVSTQDAFAAQQSFLKSLRW